MSTIILNVHSSTRNLEAALNRLEGATDPTVQDALHTMAVELRRRARIQRQRQDARHRLDDPLEPDGTTFPERCYRLDDGTLVLGQAYSVRGGATPRLPR